MNTSSIIRAIIKTTVLSTFPLIAAMSDAQAIPPSALPPVKIIAGSTAYTSSSDAPVGTDASFMLPQGIERDLDGSLIILDSGHNYAPPTGAIGSTIRRVGVTGTFPVTTIAGSGVYGATDDPSSLAASMRRVYGFARDAATGDIYVNSLEDGAVRRIAASGGIATLFADADANMGVAFEAGKLYVNGYWHPHPRVYDATTGDFLREIDVSSAGCQNNVTQSDGGLAVSNGVIYVACANRLVMVDTNDGDAVSLGFISGDGVIDSIHATNEDGVYVTADRYVTHYNALREISFPFSLPLPSAVSDIIRTDQAPASEFIMQVSEAGSPACAYGGLRMDIGNDRTDASVWYYVSTSDGLLRRLGHVIDGVLDADEIKSTSYVCNGAPGNDGANGSDGASGADGLNAAIRQTSEAAGSNCANGGIKVEVGLDGDGSGTLDDLEVDGALTAYVCNGQDGVDGLPGLDGLNGADGRDGLAGASGNDGADGTDGVDGTDGADGAPGLTGPRGIDTQGCSATSPSDAGLFASLAALVFGLRRRRH